MKRKIILILSVIIFISNQAQAEPKFSGEIFGDFYAVASHHDKAIENQNGFWIRRAYFTMDNDLDENFSNRLRFEMNSPSDFKTYVEFTPILKDAFLKYKHAGRNQVCLVGLTATPTWDNLEKFWGYRAVEKTPLDLQKGFGDSRDMGISTIGSFDSEKIFGYNFMLGNGSGTKSEVDKNKKLYLALNAKPNKSLFFEIYGDWENKKGEKGTAIYTLQAFSHIEGSPGKLGLMFSRQNRGEAGINKKDIILNIFSLFGVTKFSEKLSAYARTDVLLDPNPNGVSNSYLPMTNANKTTLVILGLDIKAGEKVNLLPNIEAVFYSKENAGKPKNDLIPKITLAYKY